MISLRTFAIVATLVALVLGLAACDDEDTFGEDLCDDDRDCPVTMNCDPATHLCVDCLEDEDCPETMRCDRAPAICVDCLEDEDCPSGWRCIEKECELIEMPPTEPESESEQEQPPYELERVECSDDEDCPEGRKCVDGQCVEAEPESEEEDQPPETVLELDIGGLFEIPDDENDVFNCDGTGELAGGILSEQLDVDAAVIGTLWSDTTGTLPLPDLPLPDVFGVTGKLSEQTVVQFLFNTPEHPFSQVSEDGSCSDGKGNLSVTLLGGHRTVESLSIGDDGKWTPVDLDVDVGVWNNIDGLFISIRWADTPYVPTTNTRWSVGVWDPDRIACDQVGLDPAGRHPMLPLLGCDTDHSCKAGWHCCDDDTCHDCCYDMHCDQGENCEYYECVEAKPEEPPPPATLKGLYVGGKTVWPGFPVNGPLTNEQIAAIACGPQGPEKFHLLYHFGPAIEVGADGVFRTEVPVGVEVQFIGPLDLCAGSDEIGVIAGTDVIDVGPEDAGDEIDAGEVKPLVECPCAQP